MEIPSSKDNRYCQPQEEKLKVKTQASELGEDAQTVRKPKYKNAKFNMLLDLIQ